MTCVVLLELEVKEEAVEGLMAGLKDIFPDTRAYEGCIDVYASQDQDKPTTIVMVERWESRAHYEKYFARRRRASGISIRSAPDPRCNCRRMIDHPPVGFAARILLAIF
ncbi:MAG: putative quinol monooxygenase [Proteobacteria bacterium]|nr:putative quinol monooxygenase [Pseudomonadota bacterium]